MPLRGRPPGAHMGRQSGRRGGHWVDSAMRVRELNSETENQTGLRNNRLYRRQLSPGAQDEGDKWRRSVTEHDNGPAPFDGADYDMYEDTNSTVAYAVELAMQDNEDWLVERALERIRRAHSEGHKNITFSKRELDALERRRLQAASEPVESQHLQVPGSGAGVPAAPPYPLDTNVYGAWARTTSATVSPQLSTTTLRSPLQPPFAGSMSRPSAFLAPPTVPRAHPDDYQRITPYQAAHSRDIGHDLHNPVDPQRGPLTRLVQRPYNNVPSHSSHVSSDLAALAAKSVISKESDSGESSPRKRSPASSGDEIPRVEVIEHKIPGSPTRILGRGSRQHPSQP